MSIWLLLLIISVAWLLWVVVCLIALEADKREGKRKPNEHFSVLPVIPLFPIAFLEIANLINWLAPLWGTRIIGGFHLILIVVFGVGIIFETRRMRAAGPKAN